jgi:putative FmdB family regulatory protein
MPIYEFRCDSCGAQFEALVGVGTEAVECRVCGAAETKRVLSAPSAPMSLVKSPGDKRRQERTNARLHQRAKADFKARRRRARRKPEGTG